MSPEDARLRPLEPRDRDAVARLLQDADVQHRLCAYPDPAQPKDPDEWMARRHGNPGMPCYAVVGAEDEFLGFVQLSGVHFKGRFGWFGVALLPEYRGHGLGRWATRELMRLARQHHGLRKILLEVREDNPGAIQLYGSLGFRDVGVLRDHYQDGERYHDVRIMERLLEPEGTP